MASTKIKMGMVGGGTGAFIGAVHRAAANLDGQIELVCGAFNSTEQASIDSGLALGLDEKRCYADYQSMIKAEAELDESERMDFVAIVTPNHLHYEVSAYSLNHGFHVLCDKPMTLNLEEAQALAALSQQNPNLLYGVTYTYSAYPLVREAKTRIANGELGDIRKVLVEYTQGWLSAPIENEEGQKQASWRLDPKKAGLSSCIGDIGVHAAQLSEFITGSDISHICADLNTFVEGRVLEDDGSVFLKFENGAKGSLNASQICFGEENNLSIRVYGEKGRLSWQQQEPNSLMIQTKDQAQTLLRAAGPQLHESTQALFRTPSGHPEGYLEAFANIYQGFAQSINAIKNKETPELNFPSLNDGLRGMAFIEACVSSKSNDEKWIEITP